MPLIGSLKQNIKFDLQPAEFELETRVQGFINQETLTIEQTGLKKLYYFEQLRNNIFTAGNNKR